LKTVGTLEVQQLNGSDVHPHGDDCRCLCGNLLARVVGDRVELKCRRCKRTHLIPITGRRAPAQANQPIAPLRKANAP
jgi:phage FluMu protein Com